MTNLTTNDLDDQQWLDDRIATIADSYEAMAKSVEDIRQNWTDGRNLQRLHPGVRADEYIKDRVPGVLRNRKAVEALVQYTDYSLRAIAQLTGYSHPTVGRRAAALPGGVVPKEPRASLKGVRTGRPIGYTGPTAYARPQTPQQQARLQALQLRIAAKTIPRKEVERLQLLLDALTVVSSLAPDIDPLMKRALAIGEARRYRDLTADAQKVIDAINKTKPKNP